MKAESLKRTIAIVRELGSELPRRFIVVGDGAECKKPQALAEEASPEQGRGATLLSGPLVDPQQACPAADRVVGVGSSERQAFAFAEPVIFAGARGLADQLSPETAATIVSTVLYRQGNGEPSNVNMARHIRSLCESAEYRARFGSFSRNFVLEHFAIERVSARLSSVLLQTRQRQTKVVRSLLDAAGTTLAYLQVRRLRTPIRYPILGEKR